MGDQVKNGSSYLKKDANMNKVKGQQKILLYQEQHLVQPNK
jgi:hypothetical protein